MQLLYSVFVFFELYIQIFDTRLERFLPLRRVFRILVYFFKCTGRIFNLKFEFFTLICRFFHGSFAIFQRRLHYGQFFFLNLCLFGEILLFCSQRRNAVCCPFTLLFNQCKSAPQSL